MFLDLEAFYYYYYFNFLIKRRKWEKKDIYCLISNHNSNVVFSPKVQEISSCYPAFGNVDVIILLFCLLGFQFSPVIQVEALSLL
jgi:hypothetical protein